MSLSLEIGANSAIFSLFDQMLMRPLPVREPQGPLAVVSLGAGFLPALRASKIDPMNALRYE